MSHEPCAMSHEPVTFLGHNNRLQGSSSFSSAKFLNFSVSKCQVFKKPNLQILKQIIISSFIILKIKMTSFKNLKHICGFVVFWALLEGSYCCYFPLLVNYKLTIELNLFIKTFQISMNVIFC